MIFVSAIVPARNEEANIARCVLSLAAQPEIAEIIVVNDQSSDRTGAILADLVQQVPQLRVLEGGELPPGWVGKNHALWLGAAEARGEWLLFTDADTTHLPGSAACALADAAANDAALVSYSPEQETGTWWERAIIPFVYCRLARHFSYAQVNNPKLPAAAANGQYLLIRRDAYDACDGHRSVAAQVLEDVALARRAKQNGAHIYFAPGKGIVRARMYRTFRAMWEGWRKNLYLLVGGSSRDALRELALVIPWIPLVLLLLGRVHVAFAWLALALLVLRHVAYGLELRANHFPLSRIQYYLPAVVVYSAALVASAWSYARGAVAWKGRTYPATAP